MDARHQLLGRGVRPHVVGGVAVVLQVVAHDCGVPIRKRHWRIRERGQRLVDDGGAPVEDPERSLASASVSANAGGEAMTIAGRSMPALGTLLVATICNSTRRSTSADMPRAQVKISSASSMGGRHRSCCPAPPAFCRA